MNEFSPNEPSGHVLRQMSIMSYQPRCKGQMSRSHEEKPKLDLEDVTRDVTLDLVSSSSFSSCYIILLVEHFATACLKWNVHC